jgi:hypothetical protein
MSKHRFILESYKGKNTRHHCPGCQHRDKTFTLYIDTKTGKHLYPTVGRCNRESKCGYHYTPKQYFVDNNIENKKESIIRQFKDKITIEFEYSESVKNAVKRISGCKFDSTAKQWLIGNNDITEQITEFSKKYGFSIIDYNPKKNEIQKPVSFIPVELFKARLIDYDANNFVKFLITLFGVDVTSELISRYFIATSKHWAGATIFWQIDKQGKIRTGKIMLYNPTTGKRVKEPFNHINWVHSLLKQPEFELRQCLFGEHLLSIDKIKPVAIVESEKTAVIASVYLPQFIWVAVGSLTNLNAEKCSILKGRTVILFPDLNGFEKWSKKAKELSNLAYFQVSDLLERKASKAEREQGQDLADFLIRFDFREFALPEPETTKSSPAAVQPLIEMKAIEQPEPVYYFNQTNQPNAGIWTHDITELENFFASIELPTHPIKLNKCSTITDHSKFIENHLATVKANNGNRTFLPDLTRLQEFKNIIQHQLK